MKLHRKIRAFIFPKWKMAQVVAGARFTKSRLTSLYHWNAYAGRGQGNIIIRFFIKNT